MNEETWRVCGNSKQLEKDLCGWGGEFSRESVIEIR